MSLTAVTGWAWRTPLGDGVDQVVRALRDGARAAAANPRFDAGAYACPWAAAITRPPAPSRHARFLRRMGLFALEAAEEALADSAVAARGHRLGVFAGYGGLRAHWDDMMPALAQQAPDAADGWERGLKLLHPFWMLQHLSNNVQALAATLLDGRGDGLTLGGANAGAQAIEAAARALAAGAIDAALVLAYDSLVEPEILVELAASGAACTAPVDRGAPPPAYDRRVAGCVPGEAAVALVLERPADAGPRARALIAAATAADGADGEPGAQGLRAAIDRLAAAGPVGVVDGAARASAALDAEERAVVAAALSAEDLPLCATLSALGQLGAASSVAQAIALACGLRDGVLPPIAGLLAPAAGPLRPLAHAVASAASAALALATGAPGLVAAVHVRRPDPVTARAPAAVRSGSRG